MLKTNSDSKHDNRSEAIREMLAQDPKAASRTIVKQLAEKGIKVTPTLVYYVKSKQNQAKRQKKRTDAAAMSQRMTANNPVELVIRIKSLAREVGGMKTLKQLVDLLAD